MSIFYCEYHNMVEDSDYVGFNVIDDDVEVCDEGLWEIQYDSELENILNVHEEELQD